MNSIRRKILYKVDKSLRNYPWAEHRDLISFIICSEYFEDYCDEENADFCEMIVVVDKDWLFEYMVKEGIENPREYLQNEYTGNDSFCWFNEVIKTAHLAMISFN